MKLSNFTLINSGVYSNTIQDGDVYYLQARDFDSKRELISSINPVLSYSKNLENHFLSKGDVLIVVKGVSFLSAVYKGQYSPAVASSVFSVIKIKNKSIILPEYLSWYLNLPSTQNDLLSKSKGTGIPSINKQVLQDLIIPLPSIQKQQLVLQLAELREKEKNMYQRIDYLKEIKMNHLILNTIKN